MKNDAVEVAFSRVLRRLRNEARLTQEQLSLGADLQRKYISELESSLKQPSVATLYKLAKALGIKPAQFVALMDEEIKRTD